MQLEGLLDKQGVQCFKEHLKNKDLRVIAYPHKKVLPDNIPNNIISHTKYSPITFVPLVLYSEFKFFLNLFFLITALSQFIPALKVGLIIAFTGPLASVLLFSMGKQAYDDIKRYLRDRAQRKNKYNVWQDGWVLKQAGDIKVGDIVQIKAGQRIPADIIVVHTCNSQGLVFIKTDQLDGETDCKPRRGIPTSQQIISKKGIQSFVSMNIRFQCNPPDNRIYQFEGVLISEEGEQGIGVVNTMWSGSLVCGQCIGVVVYSGVQSRMYLNQKRLVRKVGITDWQINNISKLLIFLIIALSLIPVILRGQTFFDGLIQFNRFMILLSSIIPISMRVNLDLAKIVYSGWINGDKEIATVARNSAIPQELARVSCLFTDKTGTLTKNQMQLQKISIPTHTYSLQQANIIQQLVQEALTKHPLQHYQSIQIKEFVVGMALCHNVNRTQQTPHIQASSPDQLALVQGASKLGVDLIQRTEKQIRIKTIIGEQKFKIIENFPFSSQRKRMGLLLQDEEGRTVYYLKGADMVMKSKLLKQFRGFVDQKCQQLGRQGLRTLVMAKKYINKQQLQKFKQNLQKGRTKIHRRQQQIEQQVCKFEYDMQLIGISGVEDQLQDGLYKSLQLLRGAGIKIWVLTGDKLQTAICVCISSGIKPKDSSFFIINNVKDQHQLTQKLMQFKQLNNCILVIDGGSLVFALERQFFFQVTENTLSVVCCRVSPLQKSYVVQKIKSFRKSKKKQGGLLAIGDGGNDVAMIQVADVGIGIVGKQGKQAALSSDYSVQQFSSIVKLLLWHGRLNLKRTALLSQFIIYRGIAISTIQLLYSCVFYYLSIPIFNNFILTGYTTIFTMSPVFAMIFGQDVDIEAAMSYPVLYAISRKGKAIGSGSFFTWLFKGMYQGSVIIITMVILFKDEVQLQTLTYSALIVTEYLMINSQMARLNKVTILCTLLTLLLYVLCITLLRSISGVSELRMYGVGGVCLVVLVCWVPVLVSGLVRRRFFPCKQQQIKGKMDRFWVKP